MGIFDNAKSITFNDKEVKSITVDGGVIYEKQTEELVTIQFGSFYTGYPIVIDDTINMTTDSNGNVVVDLDNGVHTLEVGDGAGHCIYAIDSQEKGRVKKADFTITDDHKVVSVEIRGCD